MAKTSGAQPDNQNRVALKDPDIRQIAYQSFCDHIAKGKSKDSWYFEHEELTCTYRTFSKYLQDEVEFPPIKKDIAWTKGFQHWEAITEASATGADKKKSNTASLQMVMRNKYGWDKEERNNSQGTPEQQKDAQAFNEWLRQRQIKNEQEARSKEDQHSSQE